MGDFGNIPPIYPPSYPHHIPTISTKPHHAIFMQTGESAIRYSETYIYDMVDLISRERYVQYLLYIYIYILYIYLWFRVALRGKGGLVRTATAIRLRAVCVVFGGGYWLVWLGKGWGLVGGRLGVGCKECNNNYT